MRLILFNSKRSDTFYYYRNWNRNFWEGRLVQKYVFKTRMEGFGAKKETAIFPKIVYATCEGLNFNPEDPNWDISQMAFSCMTKSIYQTAFSFVRQKNK